MIGHGEKAEVWAYSLNWAKIYSLPGNKCIARPNEIDNEKPKLYAFHINQHEGSGLFFGFFFRTAMLTHNLYTVLM